MVRFYQKDGKKNMNSMQQLYEDQPWIQNTFLHNSKSYKSFCPDRAWPINSYVPSEAKSGDSYPCFLAQVQRCMRTSDCLCLANDCINGIPLENKEKMVWNVDNLPVFRRKYEYCAQADGNISQFQDDEKTIPKKLMILFLNMMVP